MISAHDFGRLQKEQHTHDLRNHFDILSRHKTDRMKHYGLHFAKYVGRLAREPLDAKPVVRTLVDTLLVALSAANTLHQDLSQETFTRSPANQADYLRVFADAAGRFADACEKIDHMEDFVTLAKVANRDIVEWTVDAAAQRDFNLATAVTSRREELAARQFYIEG
ncbi:MAG: hypothetical protein J0H01_23080 [Rhizobiales bacterium]|nr:hypothetical protein [Hyphomicrobiales bacterium]